MKPLLLRIDLLSRRRRSAPSVQFFICRFRPLVLFGLVAALSFASQPLQAAVVEAWVRRGGGTAVAVDNDGNIVVTGYSRANPESTFGNNDLYTAKYARTNGVLLWERRYSGGHIQLPKAMALDKNGNVSVTYLSHDVWNDDYYTAKYAAADGALLWEKRYDGPPNSGDVPNAIAVDGNGNVVVTGFSYAVGTGEIHDMYTAKYGAADGVLLWEKRYNGPANKDDAAVAVAVDGSGNVVVSGYTANVRYTAKYAAVDGTLIWEKRSSVPTNGWDSAAAIAVDKNGDVVVTGSSGFNLLPDRSDFYTTKYAAADGALLWERRYNGPANRAEHAHAVAVDGDDNVIVTGSSDNGTYEWNWDFYTAKYAAADGVLLWERRYNSPENIDDNPVGIAVDQRGNVVVTGSSKRINSVNTSGSSDFYTAKYAAADGALLWEKVYNGPANAWDAPRGVALGPDGMVVVTGYADHQPNYGTTADSATVVYRENLAPVIACPTNVLMNATDRVGTVVTFTVTATDDTGVPPTIVCVPPSGSVFSVGQTTVTCMATDSDAETNTCSFTVTVLSAYDFKESLRDELVALRPSVTDRKDRRQLNAAIRHLNRALAPKLWEDEMHLNGRRGERVFHQERLAAGWLCRLLQRRIPLPFVPHNYPTEADRLVAIVAIEDAIAAGASDERIQEAQSFLARGDAEAMDARCSNGIEEYRRAWRRATR